jgi:response regulator RpfG family c-di-GMP phosphodiesterase
MHKTRVLCVEDHPANLNILQHMLKEVGYEVIPAESAEQALHLIEEESIDGVLLEYDLPDANGASVRAEMKRIKPELPILLFAGVGDHTPILIRFFDAYLRNADDWQDTPEGQAD